MLFIYPPHTFLLFSRGLGLEFEIQDSNRVLHLNSRPEPGQKPKPNNRLTTIESGCGGFITLFHGTRIGQC